MKIIHMSDIHSDFETFEKALVVVRNSGADVLAITGDLYGDEIRGDEIKVRNKMLSRYREFKDRFQELEQQVLLVPGNWDGKCIDDVLAHENLHDKNIVEINGIGFIGYGGSDMIPATIPEILLIEFDPNECYQHLSKHDNAEIALTHEIPKGLGGRHGGQLCIVQYLKDTAPSLLLTGHSHQLVIVKSNEGTIIANPGNLGRYQNQDFGTFLEIDIDKNTFVRPKAVYKIEGNSVKVHEFEES